MRAASLSLDLDNQWSYQKTHGDPGWEGFSSYLDTVVPRILEVLRRHELTITFFVVGQDAVLDKNRAALEQIVSAGHELANHSFSHEPWLHLRSRDQVEAEIVRTEEAIEDLSGKRPVGFRGPGYSVTPTVLEVLAQRGYRYDASTLPTFIGPLARAFYFRTARLDERARRERARLFGSLADGCRPLRPYRWRLNDSSLLEIPVTTMPFLRLPMHASYILFLAKYSRAIARTYFRLSLALCRLAGVSPSILLHPLDFLGRNDVTGLDFFPAMDMSDREKVTEIEWLISRLARSHAIVTVQEHARLVEQQASLRERTP